ncbi:hypothetical protein FGO68_gene6022 [Halteria grandinella]|uniref:Uncharacterized protein n=1 Tax=Halteria grandinella TaxID=5974 RepID=A0A8J8NCR2_HALGN|nr:hypothetical protein FGO68_gene6022 [Halteria grandinella]
MVSWKTWMKVMLKQALLPLSQLKTREIRHLEEILPEATLIYSPQVKGIIKISDFRTIARPIALSTLALLMEKHCKQTIWLMAV